METVVRKWGNSAAVRIPAAVLEAAGMAMEQAIAIREEQGRIVIEKMALPSYDLATLAQGIPDEDRHDPVDTGRPVGGEVW